MTSSRGDPDYEDRPDYDDRDGRRPLRRRKRQSNRSLWLILGSVGCVVLVCSGLIVAAVAWGVRTFTTDLPASTDAATHFLDLLQENRIDEAYASTSAGFHAREGPEGFKTFLKQHETFTKATSRTLNGARIFQNERGKQAFVQMTLHAPNNAMTCTLVLVEEANNWKVDDVTVP